MPTLDEYNRKRHFELTPEPRGRVHAATSAGGAFVVQKHDARRLHYDFRLELDGVLKSWAVPKGPSLDPRDRRLAVETEDHPLEYGGFEGVIPEGEYGGGTVLLWDRGRWTPQGDPRASYERGRLTFTLEGERLRGRWHLVRSSRSRADDERGKGVKQEWLLIKANDEHARPGEGASLVETATTSVESGRDLPRIAATRRRVWSGEQGEVPPTSVVDPSTLRGARPARDLGPNELALARLADAVPEGGEWVHELKLDGYRVLARLEGGDVRLITRGGHDWTERFPAVADALRGLPAEQALLDGEVVVRLPDGRTSFQALQSLLSSLPRERGELCYVAFDLLHLDGHDLRPAPLLERKRALRALVEGSERTVRFSEHVVGQGPEVFRGACAHGVEGVVSKRAASPYRPGRGLDWLKVKCLARQELVIGGFTERSDSRACLGALVVGYYDPEHPEHPEHPAGAGGALRYAGRVGTGWSTAAARALHARLSKLVVPRSPFAPGERVPRPRTRLHWVEPRLVCEVEFTEWTDEGLLRHPSFQGLREDKAPEDVVREAPSGLVASARTAPPVTTVGRVKKVGRRVEIAGITISSPEKVLYPDVGVTKEELATYYASIADWALPHLGRRPLTLVRCPSGCGKKCFYQKHGNKTVHADIPRVFVSGPGEEPYVYVETLAHLVRLVQLNVLEFHVWNSKVDAFDKADQVVMDLDPDEGLPLERVIEAALEVRDRLRELGLTSFCKTTGGKGLHVVAPIAPTLSWDDVKLFTKAFSEEFARRHPERYTSKITKSSRKGRVFIDYLRNQWDATAIGAYSARARAGATVSVPLTWSEVTPALDLQSFTVRTVPARLAALTADPWADFDAARVPVTDEMKAAVGFGEAKLPRPRKRASS